MKQKLKLSSKYSTPHFGTNSEYKNLPKNAVSGPLAEHKHNVVSSKGKGIKNNRSSQIIKNQMELKKMVARIQKDIQKLVLQKEPMDIYSSPTRTKKKNNTVKRVQTVQYGKENKLLADTKSTRAVLSPQLSVANTPKKVRQSSTIKKTRQKKALSIFNTKDFLLFDGEFIKTENEIVETMKQVFFGDEEKTICESIICHQGIDESLTISLDKDTKQKAIRQYVQRQTIIIQRWWRGILSAKRQNYQKIKLFRRLLKKSILAQCDNSTEKKEQQQQQLALPKKQHALCSQSLLIERQKSANQQEESQISFIAVSAAIKRVSTIDSENNDQNYCEDALAFRENAAKVRQQTHLCILRQLQEQRGFDQTTYFKYANMIEKSFEEETLKINSIRGLLQSNIIKVEEIIQNVKKDVFQVQNCIFQDQEKLVNQIFGKSNEDTKSMQSSQSESQQSLSQSFVRSDTSEKRNCFQFSRIQTTPQNYNAEEAEKQGKYQIVQQESELHRNVQQLISQKVSNQLSLNCSYQTVDEQNTSGAVDTSLSGISKVLSAFLSYYVDQYEEEFLHFINTPFGQNPRRRLAQMQGYEDVFQETEEDTYVYGIKDVINKEYFHEFEREIMTQKRKSLIDECYQDQQNREIAQESRFIHNMAIYDAFNEALDELRPYYETSGELYEWFTSQKSMSFYFITADIMMQVLYKAQARVIKWAGTLSGLVLDLPAHQQTAELNHQFFHDENQNPHNTLKCYQKCQHPMINAFRKDKQNKLQKIETTEQNKLWNQHFEETTVMNYLLSSFVLQSLFAQMSMETINISEKRRTSLV